MAVDFIEYYKYFLSNSLWTWALAPFNTRFFIWSMVESSSPKPSVAKVGVLLLYRVTSYISRISMEHVAFRIFKSMSEPSSKLCKTLRRISKQRVHFNLEGRFVTLSNHWFLPCQYNYCTKVISRWKVFRSVVQHFWISSGWAPYLENWWNNSANQLMCTVVKFFSLCICTLK